MENLSFSNARYIRGAENIETGETDGRGEVARVRSNTRIGARK